MTCVVALKRKDHFVFVSDSQTSTSTYKESQTTEYLSKNNHYYEDDSCLIAHTGTCSISQSINAIHNLFNSFNERYNVFDIEYVRFVARKMIKEQLASYNVLTNIDAPKIGIRLFLAKDDKCFNIDQYSVVHEVTDYAVFGCGVDVCLGSMLNSDPNLDNLIKAVKGVKAACKYDSGCGFPLIITSNKGHKRYIISEEEANKIINGEKELDL